MEPKLVEITIPWYFKDTYINHVYPEISPGKVFKVIETRTIDDEIGVTIIQDVVTNKILNIKTSKLNAYYWCWCIIKNGEIA